MEIGIWLFSSWTAIGTVFEAQEAIPLTALFGEGKNVKQGRKEALVIKVPD